jgi:hypothetical protein
MYGTERGLEHGGFSLYDFEVYGEEVQTGPVLPPSPYKASFFIPKQNETNYWWQGENARLASVASAFILGAPMADPFGAPAGAMWKDTLFAMASAQLDWILGRNPLNLCMMYGYGPEKGGEYRDYSRAARHIPNVKGGICNGITSMESNEGNIEFMPHDPEGELWYLNWRYIEQWLPHNAWYLIAVSSLSYRVDNPIEQEVSVRYSSPVKSSRLKVTVRKGRLLKMELPFAAGRRTELAMYSMQGRKVFSYNIEQGSSAVSVKIPANIARGTYVLSVRDVSGKNKIADKINLR